MAFLCNNHTGDKIAEGSRDKEEVLIGKINLSEAETLRNVWGFLEIVDLNFIKACSISMDQNREYEG